MLSPERRQAIIWTNAEILLIGPLGTNFSEIFIGIYTFSFMKMHLKMSSGKWQPFCPALNVSTQKRSHLVFRLDHPSVDEEGPLFLKGLILLPAWIIHSIRYKMS